MRAFLMVAVLVVPASAESLRMQREDAQTVHLADRGGAINTRIAATVSAELTATGRIEVKASGSDSENNLWVEPNGASRTTLDKREWSATWRGTWKRVNGELALTLALASDRCTVEGRYECKPAAKQATVACTSGSVLIGKRKVDAWMCSGGELGNTGSWTFGKRQCLKLVGGHWSAITYVAC